MRVERVSYQRDSKNKIIKIAEKKIWYLKNDINIFSDSSKVDKRNYSERWKQNMKKIKTTFEKRVSELKLSFNRNKI